MKNLALISLLALLLAACQSQKNPVELSAGSIDRVEVFHSNYITPRTVDIWKPEGYSEKNRYSVIYMNDGQMLFDSTTTWNKQEWKVDETVQELINSGKIEPCIVVAVWNIAEERKTDYFPQTPFEMLPTAFRDSIKEIEHNGSKMFEYEINSDNYLHFLTEELKPYVDANYATYTDAKHTAIMGSSMGGLISMYAICEYPDIFGSAACLSTHWVGVFTDNETIPNAFLNYFEQHIGLLNNHKLYFDHGTATLDALYGTHQKAVDAMVMASDFPESDYKSLVFEGAAHTERDWSARLEIPLLFISQKSK